MTLAFGSSGQVRNQIPDVGSHATSATLVQQSQDVHEAGERKRLVALGSLPLLLLPAGRIMGSQKAPCTVTSRLCSPVGKKGSRGSERPRAVGGTGSPQRCPTQGVLVYNAFKRPEGSMCLCFCPQRRSIPTMHFF